MDQHHDTEAFAAATRRDGWTPALKARFLTELAEAGNVRVSARRCGLSAQSAYVQRRRDAVFARAWAAALVQAHRHGEQVLAERALEGVEEPVFHRGELVGTRRRYDSRLLLAHLARLDARLEDEAAVADAARFDELVALVAGAEPPEALAQAGDVLPAGREAHAEAAAVEAEKAAGRDLPRERGAAGKSERERAVTAAGDTAYAAAASEWDAWFDRACATVDGLGEAGPAQSQDTRAGKTNAGAENRSPPDPVNASTSPAPPAERLTFAGFVFNRPADQQPRAIADAGHPSETAGAVPDRSESA